MGQGGRFKPLACLALGPAGKTARLDSTHLSSERASERQQSPPAHLVRERAGGRAGGRQRERERRRGAESNRTAAVSMGTGLPGISLAGALRLGTWVAAVVTNRSRACLECSLLAVFFSSLCALLTPWIGGEVAELWGAGLGCERACPGDLCALAWGDCGVYGCCYCLG